jgi:hypothetical protein
VVSQNLPQPSEDDTVVDANFGEILCAEEAQEESTSIIDVTNNLDDLIPGFESIDLYAEKSEQSTNDLLMELGLADIDLSVGSAFEKKDSNKTVDLLD